MAASSKPNRAPAPPRSAAEAPCAPCSQENLIRLPVFSSRRGARIRSDDLHESYHPGESVYELTLNKRAVKVVETLGIKTIGELLTTPRKTLVEQWGFGPSTLEVIHGQLKRFLLDGQAGGPEPAADLSSFEAIVKALIRMVGGEARDMDILEKRLGVSPEAFLSLGKLGKQYGLTRERIRQIEEVALGDMALRAKRKAFEPFWRAVFDILKGSRRRRSLAQLARELAGKYHWPACPDTRTFAKVMRLRPELHIEEEAGLISLW